MANEQEEKFFEQIVSEYDDYKIFAYKDKYQIDYDYQLRDNVLKEAQNYFDKGPYYYTKKRIKPGDLVINGTYIGIITYVSVPRVKEWVTDFGSKEMLFFRGDGDVSGAKVLAKYQSRRNTLNKELLTQKFLTGGNHIVLINHSEAKAELPSGKEVTFKVCRSLNDMLDKIKTYKPNLLPLLTDDNGEYRDSHFASEKMIAKLKDTYIEKVDFDGSFASLLKRLVSFVEMFGYTKEFKDNYLSYEDHKYKKDKGAEEYYYRLMFNSHFAGVNLPKNFANKDTFCFNVAPYFINEERKGYFFSREKAYGLTIYNYASNPFIIKYHNQAEYDEGYGYRSVGGDWELETKLAESYAILCLNDNPAVFTERFYEENIIFELDNKFYAYYAFRDPNVNRLVGATDIYNNPVAYYLYKQRASQLYGLANQLNNDSFNGAFARDCFDLNDQQCAALYYASRKFIFPEVSEHFYKDNTGIYSLDGKVLYVAFNENTRQYVVKDGVEEIRSYAFAYLEKVNTIILANSVKKIGALNEPVSKSKPILCPKLKMLVVPEAMVKDNIVEKCICGVNITKKQLKEISVEIRE